MNREDYCDNCCNSCNNRRPFDFCNNQSCFRSPYLNYSSSVQSSIGERGPIGPMGPQGQLGLFL